MNDQKCKYFCKSMSRFQVFENAFCVSQFSATHLYTCTTVATNKKLKVDLLYTYNPEQISDLKAANGFNMKILPESVVNEEEMGGFQIDRTSATHSEILKENESLEAFLLSTQDYNIGIDSSNETESFKEIFRRYGTSVENPDTGIKKRSLFGKIFK